MNVAGVFPAAAGGAAPARPAEDAGAREVQIEDAARQFESLLLAQLLKSMRGSGSEGWLGAGEDQTASSAMELAEEQFAQALAAQGGLGLASLVVRGLDHQDDSGRTLPE